MAETVETIELPTKKRKGDGGVQSISRALSILDRLAEFDEGMTLTELARSIALPPSSAHRILTTLQRHRFVRFEPATMSWHVGVQAFVVGNAFARSRDMVTLAVPHMRRLMAKTGETANYFMLDGEDLICMAQIQSQQTVRAISRPGGGVEMHRSAAGKAIMAHMSDAEVGSIVDRNGLPRYTEHTIVTHEALVVELARIRQRGFSIDNEEFSLGLRCIAAPIFDESGAAHAAISLAGPAGRIAENRIDALGELVALCSKSVTSEIGGRRPTALTLA